MTKRHITENRNRHAVFSFRSCRELKGALMDNLVAAQGWNKLAYLRYIGTEPYCASLGVYLSRLLDFS